MSIIILLLLAFASPLFAFDHSYASYDSVLSAYVSEGKVDYEAMKLDHGALDRFLTSCSEIRFDEYQAFSRTERMAFMINLYNAATLALVLENYPIGSVKDIGGLFSSPWNKKFIKLFDHTASLGQIENDILRVEFKDPRFHFALAQGAVDGPELLGAPYLPEKLDAQLDQQTKIFLTKRTSTNRVEKGTLYLSPIFQWYAEDFGGKNGVRKFVSQYLPDLPPEIAIEYTQFDWLLNKR